MATLTPTRGGAGPVPVAGSGAPRPPDLSVIIVTWNCADDVVRCVASVLDGTARRVEVLVVDNDSADGTAAAVARAHPVVRVIQMGANTGFARANNAGMAAAGGRHLVILNPDTVVAPGALDALVARADADPSLGVVAPRLRNVDGTDQRTARSFPTPSVAVFGRRSPLTRAFPRNRWSQRFLAVGRPDADGLLASDWVSGACMLVPAPVVEGVGGFDEDFFLYWEDADWCRRIVAAGYRVVTDPTAEVVHDEGGTRDHGWPLPVIRHFHRGAYLYWRKHHAPQPWNPARWAAAAALAARALGVVALDRLRTAAARRVDPTPDTVRHRGSAPTPGADPVPPSSTPSGRRGPAPSPSTTR